MEENFGDQKLLRIGVSRSLAEKTLVI